MNSKPKYKVGKIYQFIDKEKDGGRLYLILSFKNCDRKQIWSRWDPRCDLCNETRYKCIVLNDRHQVTEHCLGMEYKELK